MGDWPAGDPAYRAGVWRIIDDKIAGAEQEDGQLQAARVTLPAGAYAPLKQQQRQQIYDTIIQQAVV